MFSRLSCGSGVTKGRQLTVSPYLFLKNWWPSLVIALCKVMTL